ncbi:MAG TPA: alpha/beta hydrolase, partial [Methylophaga aminisulfidivorans]|nr:alpha/beta hydrolase [Methylophaga aminisulfidivorans]
VATIVAAIRDDVSLLVTAAGNLDHKRWTDFNEIEQLNGSLNPIDYSVALENVHQIHLVGERDDIVPGSILTSYLSHMKKLDNVKSFIIQGADHYCCWSIALANILD